MMNGYVIDYLREMAGHAAIACAKDAAAYGVYVAQHYDDVVRETSIPSINARLTDELEQISNAIQ
jgi:hypothetical protein